MENEVLQKKIASLEADIFLLKNQLKKVKSQTQQCERGLQRLPRTKFSTDIEFAGAFDIIEAEGVNISEGGICFEIGMPLVFDMQFEKEGDMISRRASLMWVEKREESGFYVGLKFNDKE